MSCCLSSGVSRLARRVLLPGLVAAGATLGAFGLQQAQAMEPAEIFRVVSASIVGVVASSATREERTATGVLVAPTEIVTSCAAVAGATRTLVAQGVVLRSAKISVADTGRDLCQLSIDAPLPDAQPLKSYGSTKRLTIGQPLYLMAAPRGLDRTLGRGMVSGLKLAKGEEAPLVLTDAPAPAELAGSAVLDQDGQLVGLLSAKYKDADRLSYAVPADWIAELPERAAAIAAAQQLAGNAAPQADAGPATLPAGNGQRARIPVRVGDGWSYRLVSGKPRKTIHLEVIAVDGNRITERLTTDDSSSFRVDRVVDWGFTPTRFQAPLMLPGAYQLVEVAPYFPPDTRLSIGQTWSDVPGEFSIHPIGIRRLQSELRVAAKEQVIVPAGRYQAYRLDSVSGVTHFNGNQIRVQCSFWYAPEVPRVVKIRVATFSGYGTFEDFYELVAIRAAGN